jgi:hypothetical protein
MFDATMNRMNLHQLSQAKEIHPAIPREWGARLVCAADGIDPAEFSLCLRNGNGWADYCGDHLAKIVDDDPRFPTGHQIVSMLRDVLNTRFYCPLSNEAVE